MTSPADADLAAKIKLAAEAFLYGYPLVYNLREIAKFPAGPNLVQPEPLPYNTFGYAWKAARSEGPFRLPQQRHPVPDGHVRRAQRPPGAARA